MVFLSPRRYPTLPLILCFVLLLGLAASAAASERSPAPRFPAQLEDIDGQTLDIEELATHHNLVVVTLKATWCPVCQQQLLRIKSILPKLRRCNVSFVVLSPGPAKELDAIRRRTGFDFPFVADHDLAIARSLGLAMGEKQIFPCMLQILEDRSIGWRQLGRNGAYFGDGELERYFDCSPI